MARATFRASVVEGMKTPFSTVLIVLRDTPTRSASSAWVQPRSARAWRRWFVSPSATDGAPLKKAEAHQRDADTDAKRHVHRADRHQGLEQGVDVEPKDRE